MTDVSEYPVSTQLLALYKFGGVTPRLFEALFRRHGGPENILNAETTSLMEMEGMREEAARRIESAIERLDDAESVARDLSDRDIHLKSRFDRDYPQLLLELNDPPPLLFVRGRLPRGEKRTLTLTGAENATSRGIEMASRLARKFARDEIQLVSSLTGGIDAAAHLVCKAAGVASFAVVDHGFDHLQDAERMPLAIDIAETGGIISEYLPDQESNKHTLTQANRLMVGLSQAAVVVELYADAKRSWDLLSFCSQIGKLTFFVLDTEQGALSDKESLSHAVTHGAIIIEGYDKVDDIVLSLV